MRGYTSGPIIINNKYEEEREGKREKSTNKDLTTSSITRNSCSHIHYRTKVIHSSCNWISEKEKKKQLNK